MDRLVVRLGAVRHASDRYPGIFPARNHGLDETRNQCSAVDHRHRIRRARCDPPPDARGKFDPLVHHAVESASARSGRGLRRSQPATRQARIPVGDAAPRNGRRTQGTRDTRRRFLLSLSLRVADESSVGPMAGQYRGDVHADRHHQRRHHAQEDLQRFLHLSTRQRRATRLDGRPQCAIGAGLAVSPDDYVHGPGVVHVDADARRHHGCVQGCSGL